MQSDFLFTHVFAISSDVLVKAANQYPDHEWYFFDSKTDLLLGSISPMFYEQLICMQIPEAQKDSQVKQIFALLGSASVKGAS